MTQTGQKPRQNLALRRAPDLIPPNPLSCRPGKGQRMHFDRLKRRVGEREKFNRHGEVIE
jgi:hypothetical protein